MRFLIVDDSATMRKVVILALKSGSYQYDEASDGIEALNKIEKEKYDFFLVDINMPKMNGIDLVKEIRKRDQYKKTPIVILITENENSMKEEGRNAGADDWIVKPFQKQQLFEIINNNT